MSYFLLAVMACLLALLLYWVLRMWLYTRRLRKQYGPLETANDQLTRLVDEQRRATGEINALKAAYQEKRAIYDSLLHHAAIFDESIELAELGFYKPHFDFDTSEKYKQKLLQIKDRQKQMVKNKTAIYCPKEWTVEGSRAKGQTMINRAIRLTARAFNNECDAAVSNTRWNNASRMLERVRKAFDAINKLNESNGILISNEYLELKIDELRLAHEYSEKRQREKEEQAELRRRMREEAALEAEMDRAIRDEEKYEDLLERARRDASTAVGDKLDALRSKIALLESELVEAHAKSERAKSMAQQTKAGHIYVISNVGSFGEHVYKIGMTRRLDPLDRVRELGDASVPFLFDVHAVIYSENAPQLERELHQQFDAHRLNLVNFRKEFFGVQLDDIKGVLTRIAPDAEIIETAESREYRETLALRAQRERQLVTSEAVATMPDSI